MNDSSEFGAAENERVAAANTEVISWLRGDSAPGPGCFADEAHPAGVTDEDRIARAMLTWVAEPGRQLAGALATVAGAVPTVEMIRAGDLAGITNLLELPEWPAHSADQELQRLRSRLERAPSRDEISRVLDGSLRLVCPGDHEWPGQLDELGAAAPVALWVNGAASLRFACRRSVAVTGSRAASAYGTFFATGLSASLAARGVCVIAGGSFGVEAAGHRGVLGSDGQTIAVAAGGPDTNYPAGHAELFAAITVQGAVVSEAPPGTMVNRSRFQARGRVMAALAAATVIVEAGARSTSLSVAGQAHDLGRPLMAVPGPVTSDLSAGCHDLIRSGRAVLVTSAQDVIEALPPAIRPAQ